MPSKQFDLPMQMAKAFVHDMSAYFAEPNAIKRDEIAGRQAWLIAQHFRGKVRTDSIRAHEGLRPIIVLFNSRERLRFFKRLPTVDRVGI
jgi:hypothetical protein